MSTMDDADRQRLRRLVPRYHDLVGEANAASMAVDDFDLHSDDPASAREFQRLTLESDQAQLDLIKFVGDHGTDIAFALGLIRGEAIQRLRRPAED